MAAWGVLAFDNDDARQWVGTLHGASDLSQIEAALAAVDESEFYLEASVATVAVAACEVLARLRGNAGYEDASTESVDRWVNENPLRPPSELLDYAASVLGIVLGPQSELREIWTGPRQKEWIAAVEELRRRMNG